MNDEFRLQRFLDAQAPIYDDAVGLLRGGAMCTPYMDCIFPRFAGRDVFGDSDTRKLHASLTLFAAATNEPLMRIMLAIWFDNLVDEATIAGIGEAARATSAGPARQDLGRGQPRRAHIRPSTKA